MSKLFGKKKTKIASGNSKEVKQEAKREMKQEVKQETKQEATALSAKQVQAVLVFSLRPLGNPQTLLKQISEQQLSHGHTLASKCVVRAATVKDLNDKAFISAIVKREFPDMNAEELIKRANVYPFQGSDGNAGKYCVVFDRA